MSKVEKIVCVKDFFAEDSKEKITSTGTVYKLDNDTIINDMGSICYVLVNGEKGEFFNEHFIPVNIAKEDDPIDALMQQSEKFWDKTGKEPQQQSEHYKKDNAEDLETIDKMQIISDIFEEQGRTFTAMEGYTLLNQYKYLDRMGKKDDHKKEGYKICDYYERNKSGKWLHEVDK